MPSKPNDAPLIINMQSDPFLGDPEGADVYYAAVGRLVRLWGRFENHLDHALLSIANLPEAQTVPGLDPHEMPAGMGKKADL